MNNQYHNLTNTNRNYVLLMPSMTCMSSLNVSGTTTLNYNVICMNNLNINGALYCSSINSTTTSVLSNALNSLSSYSYLNISGLNSNLNNFFIRFDTNYKWSYNTN